MQYDVIGDIHGHSQKLRALLTTLGYRERGRVWRHADRTAIFVGDFVDRGPDQLDTVDVVRRMVDAGAALATMGNHEFNAIAWHTPDPAQPGEFLRPHQGSVGAKNRQQHAAFLAAVEGRPIHDELIEWFLALPLWLDLPDLRIVHACWHEEYMAFVGPLLQQDRTLDLSMLTAASRRGSREYLAIEALLKGVETKLPDGCSFRDKDGHERDAVRVRWWDSEARTYRAAAMMDETTRSTLTDSALPKEALVGYEGKKPVFFGHYWLQGQPRVQSPKVACVDYSAGGGGPLVAYRWEGEPELDSRHFAVV